MKLPYRDRGQTGTVKGNSLNRPDSLRMLDCGGPKIGRWIAEVFPPTGAQASIRAKMSSFRHEAAGLV